MPPIAAISLSPRARAFHPTSAARCVSRRKCTSSISISVVNSKSSAAVARPENSAIVADPEDQAGLSPHSFFAKPLDQRPFAS